MGAASIPSKQLAHSLASCLGSGKGSLTIGTGSNFTLKLIQFKMPGLLACSPFTKQLYLILRSQFCLL